MSTDGKHWWEYVDRTVTLQLLDGRTLNPVFKNAVLRFAVFYIRQQLRLLVVAFRANPRVSSDSGEDAQ